MNDFTGVAPDQIPSRATVSNQLTMLALERAAETPAPVPDTLDGRAQLVHAEFEEVGGGSTAWLHLIEALAGADNECNPGSEAYWDWAWNTYCNAQAELETAENKRLSYAYNLDELSPCWYCGNRVVEHEQVECEHDLPFHAECLGQWQAEQESHGDRACAAKAGDAVAPQVAP